MFKGSIPALITPFRDGRIDEQDFQSFVDWQIKEGSHGVFPCGTTGESPTLTHQNIYVSSNSASKRPTGASQ